MPRFIILGVVILNLALFYPSSPMAFMASNNVIQNNAPSKAATKSSSKAGPKVATKTRPNIATPAPQRDVVNIVVDRIEGALIYSKDGGTFEVPNSAKVIDNSHPVTKMRIAELVFENGSLVAVNIK
jgi:hypothetical protein